MSDQGLECGPKRPVKQTGPARARAFLRLGSCLNRPYVVTNRVPCGTKGRNRQGPRASLTFCCHMLRERGKIYSANHIYSENLKTIVGSRNRRPRFVHVTMSCILIYGDVDKSRLIRSQCSSFPIRGLHYIPGRESCDLSRHICCLPHGAAAARTAPRATPCRRRCAWPLATAERSRDASAARRDTFSFPRRNSRVHVVEEGRVARAGGPFHPTTRREPEAHGVRGHYAA